MPVSETCRKKPSICFGEAIDHSVWDRFACGDPAISHHLLPSYPAEFRNIYGVLRAPVFHNDWTHK